jgi:hypothetical protein
VRTCFTALNNTLSCLEIALRRAGGVVGSEEGQASVRSFAAADMAVLSASSLACCSGVGCTALSICSAAHRVALTAALQPAVARRSRWYCSFTASRRAFCSSVRTP